MLYQVGPLQFDIAPANLHEVNRWSATDYAKKPVVGRRQPHEYVGEGDDRLVLRGRLFPYKTGGLGCLEVANSIRASHAAQMVCRGDGAVLGWFIITDVHSRDERLGPNGVGQIIEVQISLEKADPPSAENHFANVFSLSPGGDAMATNAGADAPTTFFPSDTSGDVINYSSTGGQGVSYPSGSLG